MFRTQTKDTTDDKTAIAGPRRFQWKTGRWFGIVIGSSAWLIPNAAILALNGQPRLALLPAGCWLIMNVTGGVLWIRRDRVLPFPAMLGVFAMSSSFTPLVWLTVSINATPESLVALNWPQQGIGFIGTMSSFIGPVIIAWLCVLEYSHRRAAVAPN